MMTHEPHEPAALTAESFLTLIERHLPELWQAHARSGNRSLRLVLRNAEALLAARAGIDRATWRRRRGEQRRERWLMAVIKAVLAAIDH